ncbi:MAG: hypothetical protein GY786_19340, partial [Proteobacteria bacterium]|nr:hypothetical protein [Pseudomonadota bacterium]
MIIKSMSRKEPSFTKLYDYITRDGDHDNQYTFTQNFILRERDEILEEFQRNAALLSRRKNGNYLYHEVISITRARELSEARQKELLQDIITQYAKSRGKDCLIFGGMHDEKDNNLHYHLMISANALDQSRRYSLKKASFNKIKKLTELYVLERYPELEQAKLISKEHGTGNTSNKEQELKRRTGKPSLKDLFKDRLVGIFEKSVDKKQFFDNLEQAQIEIYTRGKTIGFVDLESGRKHRLKTLGLEAEFEAVNSTLSKAHAAQTQNTKTDTSQKNAADEKVKSSQTKQKAQSKQKQQPKGQPGQDDKKAEGAASTQESDINSQSRHETSSETFAEPQIEKQSKKKKRR